MHQIFEAGMLICFGASWPFAVYKTWKTKSAHGKSMVFLWLVFIGYLSGVASKILGTMSWVVGLYVLNAAMVFTDIVLCYRYRRPVDAAGESADATPAAE
jgi:NhaP-type Na+/H+ or K+/H+ antiporter